MTNKILESWRTAGILVNVYPAGGTKVKISAENTGPTVLSAREMIVILREAADQMEQGKGYTVNNGETPLN